MERVGTAMLPIALVPMRRIPLFATMELPASSASILRAAGERPIVSEA
jgi:hypothetical protein